MVNFYPIKDDYSGQVEDWLQKGGEIKKVSTNQNPKIRFNNPSQHLIDQLAKDNLERGKAKELGSDRYISARECKRCKSASTTRFVANDGCAFCKYLNSLSRGK